MVQAATGQGRDAVSKEINTVGAWCGGVSAGTSVRGGQGHAGPDRTGLGRANSTAGPQQPSLNAGGAPVIIF